VLKQNHPNPFNPRTTISYSLPKGCQVKLTIHDVRGRLVAALVDSRQEAGEHSAEWAGTTRGEARAPSGSYFARLETVSGVRTIKLILAK